ncbi:MAG: hypothetical protein COX79_05190 [Candidatus Levybacteria bacterium CG_4_10_14_0_2_um_filter_36_16]|nr:MAG: hypothetical protein AUK12_00960 [Candidatus Levybacteria bacterium CG2_30_37_29]PIR79350.1 MAG: hypothetical protein COU26_01575 [Candidatus Levybacteria bacterium CG10_big_fil_rev_8_21_14_0_10_36_30]PIZ96451.1 MAG: hypothetical protein COX79_05190 [Candidatus Levybacteria bacterium CG_4_10_14_0_2_um_filter_36_16]PJA90377.1 MAG: hypothetical protein CO136_02295 [Candidatus Levybacteria bacterium CG_4_9_14_3_um_filter_36_7]
MILTYLLPFLVTLFVSIILTPLVIRFAKKIKLIDDPKTHNHPALLHKNPIPRAGGLALFFALVTGMIIFLPLNSVFLPIIIGGTFVVVVGLLDDKYDLSPYLRFAANIFCASIVVFSGATIPYITNPLGGILHFQNITFGIFGIGYSISLGSILAVVWIVWVMNMLNWSKGVDGQMPGIVVISSCIIGLAALRFPVLTNMNIYTSQLSFMVAGASLGFLVYNFYPAKIFPGYSATILGFLLGILSLLSGVKLATALLVLGVPAADAFFTIIRRILSKKSPFWHDKGHLHHLLLKLGMGHRSIAIFYWLMSLFLGIFALNLSSRGKLFAIILVVVVVGAGIVTLKFLIRRGNKK